MKFQRGLVIVTEFTFFSKFNKFTCVLFEWLVQLAISLLHITDLTCASKTQSYELGLCKIHVLAYNNDIFIEIDTTAKVQINISFAFSVNLNLPCFRLKAFIYARRVCITGTFKTMSNNYFIFFHKHNNLRYRC